jgi:hypothetical protein
MSRYDVVLSSLAAIRLSGVVTADSLTEAVTIVERECPVQTGDELLIGVTGFPPLRLACTGMERRGTALRPRWRPTAVEGVAADLVLPPEYPFYSFYGGFDKAEERPSHKSFREWLDQWCDTSPIQLREHPTSDYEKVPNDVLNAAAKSITELLRQGHTVVLMDSGGEQRTRQVCCYMGAVEDSSVG